ncbi:hypothetical protein FACS1894216_21040 [Synergistales bacterium]|nr:hypothetical protein FACS1894216_21040 [Synergistales bacterium]
MRFIGESRAYSVASRSANNSFEFMPWKDIEKAYEVEILEFLPTPDSALKLDEGWIYVSLDNPDGSEKGGHVAVISLDESTNSKHILPVPGSEHVKSLSFEGKVFSDDLSPAKKTEAINASLKGARVLITHIGVSFDTTSTVDSSKTRSVTRDRSLPIRKAFSGVTLENGEELLPTDLTPKPILRYRVGTDPVLTFHEDSEYSDVPRDKDGWGPALGLGEILDDFDSNTSLDVSATLPPQAANPVITLIAVDPKAFEKDMPGIGNLDDRTASKKLLDFLNSRGVNLDNVTPTNINTNGTPIDDFFDKETRYTNTGCRTLIVSEGKLSPDSPNTYRMKIILNFETDMKQLGGYLREAYMIALVRYEVNGTTRYWATYVKLASYIPEVRDKAMEAAAAAAEGRNTTQNEYGEDITWYSPNVDLKYYPEANSNEGKFTMTAKPGTTGTNAPALMIKLTSDDFAHMKPRREGSPDLYGVTNYAVYVDAQLTTADGKEGYGVFLNGSKTLTRGSEYSTSGYVFQFDPHAKGFPIRFFGYNNNGAYSEGKPTINNVNNIDVNWGVRPLYFYDAAKGSATNATLYAPREINTVAGAEDFSVNAGADPKENINYRTPFLPQGAYKDQIATFYGTTNADAATANRRDRAWNPTNNYYGMSQSTYSVYFPKLMQSWHIAKANASRSGGYIWDGQWGTGGTDAVANWTERHILKLTILEVTRDVLVSEVDSDWTNNIHHTGGAGNATIIHASGDLFVRAELIQLKPNTNVPNPYYKSRYYVYSKPIWYGKIKGDNWSGDSKSPFKKMSNTMPSIVADREPEGGDSQTYRRREMHVRSWKDEYTGWDFKSPSGGWYSPKSPIDHPDLDSTKEVWTPPIAVNLNAGSFTQEGSTAAGTFGQYTYNTTNPTTYPQYIGKNTGANAYNGDYTNYIYGRLSYLRPQGSNDTPIYGLYAMRGWDYGTSALNNVTYDANNTNKRFLSVVQGLRLPHNARLIALGAVTNNLYRGEDGNPSTKAVNPSTDDVYARSRDRVLAFRFWNDTTNTNTSTVFTINDMWIGEGFTPKQVRDILGLKKDSGTYRDDALASNPQVITGLYAVPEYYGEPK